MMSWWVEERCWLLIGLSSLFVCWDLGLSRFPEIRAWSRADIYILADPFMRPFEASLKFTTEELTAKLDFKVPFELRCRAVYATN
jgi:hypothetical protein